MKFSFSNVGKYLILTVLSVLGLSAKSADMVDLEFNTVYEVPKMSFNWNGLITPDQNGVLVVYFKDTPSQWAVYDNADPTNTELSVQSNYVSEEIEGINFGTRISLNATAGTTYRVFMSNWNSSSNYVLCQLETNEIELTACTPEQGSSISVSTDAQLDIEFNCNVKVESATVTCGDMTTTFPYSTAGDSKLRYYGNIVTVIMKETLYGWLSDGSVSAGDALNVTLNGLCRVDDESIKYGEDGKLTLNYVVAAMPAQLVSSVNTPDQMPNLKSYYLLDDTTGTIILTFDKEMLNSEDDAPYAVLGTGNKESIEGDYYEETVPVIVDGYDLIINLQGVLRNASTMNLSMHYGFMQLDVKNVKSVDGQYVYDAGSGKMGSINYMYGFENVVCDIFTEITPSKGEIKAGDTIELWISGESQLRYDGISFAYGENEVVVTDYSKEADTEDDAATIINVVVPTLENIESGDEVVLTLKNVIAADGLDHANDVKATYTYTIAEVVIPEFSITPAGGSIVDKLAYFELTNEAGLKHNEAAANATISQEANEVASVVSVTVSGNVATLVLNQEVTEEGEYTLTIPAGYFLVGEANVESEEMSFSYTVKTTSVNSIIGDEGAADVYTIQGVKLYEKVSVDVISNLEKGLYIINGKKVMIK